jgi:hypothetical protein
MHARRFSIAVLRPFFAAGVILIASNISAAVIIDDFSVGPIALSRTGATPVTATQSGLDPAHVLGGGREISIGTDGSAVQTLTIDTTVGELITSSDPNLTYYRIRYGSDASPLNLNFGVNRAILLEATDLPAPNITLFSAGGTANVGPSFAGVTQRPLPVGTAYLMPLSLFQSRAVGAFDPTLITSIQISAVRQSGTARLTTILIVPEPGGAVLLVCAAVILGRPLRRGWL